MRNIIKSFFFLVCLSFAANVHAQFSGGLYTDASHLKFALGYNINDKFWADAKFYPGFELYEFTPEITMHYNFIRKPKHEVYTGIGFFVNEIYAVVVPIGIAIRPFESLKNFSFDLEVKPLYDENGYFYLIGAVGCRYIIR